VAPWPLKSPLATSGSEAAAATLPSGKAPGCSVKKTQTFENLQYAK